MNRHPTDVIALVFGLAFVMAGAAFVMHELAGNHLDPAWLAAVGLVVLGVVALAATLFRKPVAVEPAESEPAAVEAPSADE